MKSIRILFLSALCAGMLQAIVGDWVSYGSQLTLTDLQINDNILSAASHGGLVSFDIQKSVFFDNSRNETLTSRLPPTLKVRHTAALYLLIYINRCVLRIPVTKHLSILTF